MARLRTPAGQADPFPLYAELREMGEVVPAPWGGHLVTSYDAANEVLRGKSWLVPDADWRARQGADAVRWDRPAVHSLSRTLSGLNPPEHPRQRRALGNIFDRNTLAGLRGPVAKTVETLLDRLEEQLDAEGEADFVSLVSEELPVAALGHWMGIPEADQPLVRRLTHEHVYAGELLPTKSQLAISDDASDGLREYFLRLVRERRRNPADDALSGWIRTWDELEPDQEVADETLYYLAMFISMASLETTSTTLSTMLWLLDRNPSQHEWLRAHPEHVPDAVEETVRFDPPIHVISRIPAEDTTLAGRSVSVDEVAHVLLGAAHHDPRRFDAAEEFDLRRSGPHLGFGGGVHYCIGSALARLEANVLLEALLRRFPRLRVSSPPSYASRVVFRRLTGMSVVRD
ncbi:cytochrome P450 [Streptomyces sp. TR06-5]|uniref:cytochrome P450 n=1 Tax=unclassified Streptomyces TaxID=2593676 RepID=UPI0039A059AE